IQREIQALRSGDDIIRESPVLKGLCRHAEAVRGAARTGGHAVEMLQQCAPGALGVPVADREVEQQILVRASFLEEGLGATDVSIQRSEVGPPGVLWIE